MKVIDINFWNRKLHYKHFIALKDPYFSVTIPIDVTKAYQFSKENNISFFGRYLHDCMRGINAVENFKYRIENDLVVEYDMIHASPTLIRPDNTYGFSFIDFHENLNTFLKNIEAEKERINRTMDLYPPKNGINCIHCSALPWFQFSGHKEPFSGVLDSVPKLAFSKIDKSKSKLIMNVSVSVNHALVDGYHVGLFTEKFQEYLNE